MTIFSKMKIFEEYDEKIKDLGNYGSGHIIYSFGTDYAKELVEKALKLDCYIEIIYSRIAIDKVDRLLFRSHKDDRIIEKIEMD